MVEFHIITNIPTGKVDDNGLPTYVAYSTQLEDLPAVLSRINKFRNNGVVDVNRDGVMEIYPFETVRYRVTGVSPDVALTVG